MLSKKPAKKNLPESEVPPADALMRPQITQFRRKLHAWYRLHARVLPWRGVDDPYQTWVSEIMLQQTRVAAVGDYYHRFISNFPTVLALALAHEDAVLAAWSGLGYYRRARLLHRAAKFLVQEHGGVLPRTSVALRRLPGVGEYTSAAVASIAFDEPVAVVDGNVERVLLRITGRPEDRSAAGRTFVTAQAQALVPQRGAGDHNQAMMELGATVCLPRGPLCTVCPVYSLCRTRGEHATQPRQKILSRTICYALVLRKSGTTTQVLLHRRAANESLMPGMMELPPLTQGPPRAQPLLQLRHGITTTNYYVEVYSLNEETQSTYLGHLDDLTWTRTSTLRDTPLTGLARKVLERTGAMPPSVQFEMGESV
jgi:A/G-specific adenine glycosylase